MLMACTVDGNMSRRTAREREEEWDLHGKRMAGARAPLGRGPAPAPDTAARTVPAAPRAPIMHLV